MLKLRLTIFSGLVLIITPAFASPGYIAPNASSYMAGRDFNTSNHYENNNYYSDDYYYPYYYDEAYYDPYFYPMYGEGMVIPLTHDDNANKYGSQDNIKPSNIINESNGEVIFNQ